MMLELTGKDILALTNESKRKAVLADWQNWGIWHKAPDPAWEDAGRWK